MWQVHYRELRGHPGLPGLGLRRCSDEVLPDLRALLLSEVPQPHSSAPLCTPQASPEVQLTQQLHSNLSHPLPRKTHRVDMVFPSVLRNGVHKSELHTVQLILDCSMPTEAWVQISALAFT